MCAVENTVECVAVALQQREDEMSKSLSLIALFALSTFVAAPTAANTGPREDCLLHAGCFYDSGSQEWVCPDPKAFMLCSD